MTDFAFVSLTVTASVVVYTAVRCGCGRRLMDWPGHAYAREIADMQQRSGRGPTVTCPRCAALVEVVEHAA